MLGVMVVGIVEKGGIYGIWAGCGRLKDPSDGGTIKAGINLRKLKQYYQLSEKRIMTTYETGMRNSQKEEIAEKRGLE